MFIKFGLLIFFSHLCYGANLSRLPLEKQTCGYKACIKSDPGKINIHVVAHTHDDVGWLKTVDQYYYGSQMKIQVAGVQYIIDSVVEALSQDRKRKFIYVETAFLWKWWQKQSKKKKEIFKNLINEGRLEIIGGGWSMNDEAVTHYHSIIDQYTWGFRRLNDTLGICSRPKIGWQIDPFGHSREQASMFAQLGFDGMLFGRLDYQDKSKRLKEKTTEFIWKASPSLGVSSDLFTSMLFNNYGPPPGFCFDILCQDAEPIIDDAESPDYNVAERTKSFLNFVDEQRKSYRSRDIILTMGGDFTYQNAEMYFKNMDKLIRYVNEINGSQYKAFYSTPSCYLKALNEQDLFWPIKTDDFFPYSSDPHAFWTGYFTSRPTLKYYERTGNNFLQVIKQLAVLSNEYDSRELQLFREAMGVMQHHDAVTGTEKQHVAEDYARLLYNGFRNGEKLADKFLNKLAKQNETSKIAKFESCLLLNISVCDVTSENKIFVVTVYNPTSQPLTTFVRVPVQGLAYTVNDFTGGEIITQIIPIPDQVKNIPGRVSKATNELIFKATNISALGFQSFYISEYSSSEPYPFMEKDFKKDVQAYNAKANRSTQYLKKGYFNVTVEPSGKIYVRSTLEKLNYEQSFHYYEAAEGNNKVFSNRSSGAYIFRPKENTTKLIPINDNIQVFDGPHVLEIHQVLNSWISQVIKIYNEQQFIEYNWLVGPIPISDKIGKEIITRYSSNLKNNGEFQTDSNGREMLNRKVNYRPTWDVKLEEPIAGNYYPITTKISIKDRNKKLKLSALVDRAQGSTSLEEGDIEIMIHRRLLSDDAFGVGEALNETAYGEGLVARGQHFLIGGSLENLDELILKEKELAIQLALRPWIFVSPGFSSFEEWRKNYKMMVDGIVEKLPKNIHILTLEPWKAETILIRFEHIFEKAESSKYSLPVQINLQNLFSGFTVQSFEETTLGANLWAKDLQRLKWQSETNEVIENKNWNESIAISRNNSFIIEIKPMEIKTFIVNITL